MLLDFYLLIYRIEQLMFVCLYIVAQPSPSSNKNWLPKTILMYQMTLSPRIGSCEVRQIPGEPILVNVL